MHGNYSIRDSEGMKIKRYLSRRAPCTVTGLGVMYGLLIRQEETGSSGAETNISGGPMISGYPSSLQICARWRSCRP